MDCKLSQRAATNGAVELLVSLAILWRRQMRSAALRLPEQCCQHQKGGTQHFPRESIGPEEFWQRRAWQPMVESLAAGASVPHSRIVTCSCLAVSRRFVGCPLTRRRSAVAASLRVSKRRAVIRRRIRGIYFVACFWIPRWVVR